MRDSASESCAFEMCFCEMSDLMMRTAFSTSSFPNNDDVTMRRRASSMFFTVMPVAYTCGTLLPRSI